MGIEPLIYDPSCHLSIYTQRGPTLFLLRTLHFHQKYYYKPTFQKKKKKKAHVDLNEFVERVRPLSHGI